MYTYSQNPIDVMATRDVPFGWESRNAAAWDPIAAMEGNPQANWMVEKMDQKYPIPAEEDTKNADAPFGWGNRTNTVTLQDLSMSNTALSIAVAEIHLKEDATDVLNTKKYSQHSRLDEIEKKLKGQSAQVEANKDSNNNQLMSLLVNAVTQMDQKMNAMQQTLSAVEQKVEHLTEIEENLLKILALQNKST